MKFVLKKKKNVLKTITNLHSVNQKTSKGKKMKRKEMNKGTCAVKKKIILKNLRLKTREESLPH